MTTGIKTMKIVAVIAFASLAVGCSPSTVVAAPASEGAKGTGMAQPAADPLATSHPNEAKVSAPVQVSLTSSAKVGTVVITLTVQPKTDIARGVARIVLPQGVRLVDGRTEVELGALKGGVVSQHQVTVEVPSTGQFQIFGGVDCHITSGIRLHKGAEALVLGQTSAAQAVPTP